MVEVEVLTLVVVNGGAPSFLVLQPVDDESLVVPICIGPSEALALGCALEQARFARPMTHDLMLDALTNLDSRIDHVFIGNVRNGTFYARLNLRHHDRLIDLDARPSDAISLALRQGAPVFVDESVLERAAVPYMPQKPQKPQKLIDREGEVEDFRTFLESISPDDFVR